MHSPCPWVLSPMIPQSVNPGLHFRKRGADPIRQLQAGIHLGPEQFTALGINAIGASVQIPAQVAQRVADPSPVLLVADGRLIEKIIHGA